MKTTFDRVFRDASLQALFERDGFVVIDLLQADEVAALRAVWDASDDEVKTRPFSATIMSPDLAYRRRVSEAVVGLLSQRLHAVLDDYRFCHGVFVAKCPGMDEGHVSLHQDQSFVDEERFTAAVVWLPLTDVTRRNGCLRAVRGSHRFNHGARGTYRDWPYPELRGAITERYLADLPMRAGQACLAAPTLFHESEANRSDTVRVAACALAIPRQSRLLYHYQDATDRMQRFEVPDDFYLRYTFGDLPAGMESTGAVDASTEPLTLEQLAGVCRPAP